MNDDDPIQVKLSKYLEPDFPSKDTPSGCVPTFSDIARKERSHPRPVGQASETDNYIQVRILINLNACTQRTSSNTFQKLCH